MRKIVSPATKCDKCGHIIEYEKSEEFCDQCGKLVDTDKTYPLHLTVFVHGTEETYDAKFCSWTCVRNYVLKNKPKLSKADFLTLPYPCSRTDGKTYAENTEDFYREFLCEPTKPKRKAKKR